MFKKVGDPRSSRDSVACSTQSLLLICLHPPVTSLRFLLHKKLLPTSNLKSCTIKKDDKRQLAHWLKTDVTFLYFTHYANAPPPCHPHPFSLPADVRLSSFTIPNLRLAWCNTVISTLTGTKSAKWKHLQRRVGVEEILEIHGAETWCAAFDGVITCQA